ncbi:MAG: AP-4-A phosphorylase [Dehalococcoidia bacterium]|nr:AP-4-A phosphorylase [Chloroflexota bacterium]
MARILATNCDYRPYPQACQLPMPLSRLRSDEVVPWGQSRRRPLYTPVAGKLVICWPSGYNRIRSPEVGVGNFITYGVKMEHLWAPWRMEYILEEKAERCIFCEKPGQDTDGKNYIVRRGERNFSMLNIYPYNPGHLMVAPYRHVASLGELSDEELLEHFRLVDQSVAMLTGVLRPSGFNIGINLGKVAGAGVESHIHTHIVPRWEGDTNFMPVICDAKVVPEALADTYAKLVLISQLQP